MIHGDEFADVFARYTHGRASKRIFRNRIGCRNGSDKGIFFSKLTMSFMIDQEA